MSKKHRAHISKQHIHYFSWLEYLGMLVAMGVLAGLPALLFGAPVVIDVWLPYIPLYILYWAIIAAIFCAVTVYQKYKRLDMPMRKLSEATGRVAAGDFSAFIEPLHNGKNKDYTDLMIEDFNKMLHELASIETLKSDFASNVSHEIKTPLSVIANYAQALKTENLTQEERTEYLDDIIGAANSLSSLVTNILRLNRLENIEIMPVSKPYDLCRQLSEIAIALEKSLEDKHIDLAVEMEEKRMLCYEPDMLRLVWHNLLSNAVKFTPAGGKITLSQSCNGHKVTVSVADTGQGMDAETLKRIFDKFYQGDVSHSGEGNGLGLALAKRIIDLVHGTITVQSIQGKGSVFTVELAVK